MVDEPRIRVDEDWKEQAEEEKRQLDAAIGTGKRAAPPAGADAGGSGDGGLGADGPGADGPGADGPGADGAEAVGAQGGGPAAGGAQAGGAERDPQPATDTAGHGRVSLLVLVEQLAAQAMTCLGQMPDPRTGQTFLELELARDTIDLIGVLEEKTRGNLTAEEKQVMGEVLHSLRVGYTSVSRAAAQRAMQGEPVVGGGGAGAGGAGAAGPQGNPGTASL